MISCIHCHNSGRATLYLRADGWAGCMRVSAKLHIGICRQESQADVNGAFGILNKVLPERVYASFGVGANLPGPQSPLDTTRGFCKVEPTTVAKFDLGNWSVRQILL